MSKKGFERAGFFLLLRSRLVCSVQCHDLSLLLFSLSAGGIIQQCVFLELCGTEVSAFFVLSFSLRSGRPTKVGAGSLYFISKEGGVEGQGDPVLYIRREGRDQPFNTRRYILDTRVVVAAFSARNGWRV